MNTFQFTFLTHINVFTFEIQRVTPLFRDTVSIKKVKTKNRQYKNNKKVQNLHG